MLNKWCGSCFRKPARHTWGAGKAGVIQRRMIKPNGPNSMRNSNVSITTCNSTRQTTKRTMSRLRTFTWSSNSSACSEVHRGNSGSGKWQRFLQYAGDCHRTPRPTIMRVVRHPAFIKEFRHAHATPQRPPTSILCQDSVYQSSFRTVSTRRRCLPLRRARHC